MYFVNIIKNKKIYKVFSYTLLFFLKKFCINIHTKKSVYVFACVHVCVCVCVCVCVSVCACLGYINAE